MKVLKEVGIGTVININGSKGTVLRIQDGLALVKWASGSQTCWAINGIRENQIVSTEEQLKLL